ncbi:replication-relaxation family protein [Piscibacillus sp. B03]|uniref:replication-relaxation family protein n=1 Tax=Piscibacillus sp. B03 TaxID=3457430 RepID=UPI003FCD03D5
MELKEIKRKEKGNVKTKYKVIDGRTNEEKGIELSREELHILYFLAKHRIATLEQLYRFFKLHQAKPKYSFYNRIRKFVDHKLLRTVDYVQITPWSTKKIAYMGKRGLDILLLTEFITQSEYTRYVNYRKPSLTSVMGKSISDHSVLTSEVSSRLMPFTYGYSSGGGYGKAFDFSLLLEGNELIVSPDFIHELADNRFIYIEVDTGSERMPRFREKWERYKRLGELKPECQHIVVFVVVDDSLPTNSIFPSQRKRRLRTIQQSFVDYDLPDNVKVWALPLRSIVEERSVLRLFDDLGDEPIEYVEALLTDIETQIEHSSYEISEAEWRDDIAITTFKNKETGFSRELAFIPLIEGDAHSFGRISRFLESNHQSIDLFVAVFANERSMYDGVLPTEVISQGSDTREYLYRQLMSTYPDQAINAHGSFPLFYREVGLHGDKEVIDFASVLARGRVTTEDV